MEKKDCIEIMIARITKMCSERGISTNQFGVQSGAGKDIVANMKKGSLPTSDKLVKSADYLECSVDYLLGRTDEPNISGNYINGDNSVQAIQNSSVTINQVQKETDQENQELLNLIQSLPLKKRAKIITMIYDELEEDL